MNAPLTLPTVTTEQLLAMPDDGMERWLIRGELREKPMTVRNRFHSRALIRVGTQPPATGGQRAARC